jgi:hypothetical protein
MRLRNNTKWTLLTGVVALACLTTWAAVLPPNSNASGDSLAGWMKTYWTWAFTGEPASGQFKNVLLVPLPGGEDVTKVGGSDTYEDPGVYRGHLNITVKAGTRLVLPCVFWLGEQYVAQPGEEPPVDPPAPDEWFGDDDFIGAIVTVDGKQVISNENAADFYVPMTEFDEPIMYAEPSPYGSNGLVYIQGIGLVIGPLSVGQHTVTNYAWFKVPPPPNPWGASWGTIYDNSWTITVVPQAQLKSVPAAARNDVSEAADH